MRRAILFWSLQVRFGGHPARSDTWWTKDKSLQRLPFMAISCFACTLQLPLPNSPHPASTRLRMFLFVLLSTAEDEKQHHVYRWKTADWNAVHAWLDLTRVERLTDHYWHICSYFIHHVHCKIHHSYKKSSSSHSLSWHVLLQRDDDDDDNDDDD